MCAAFTRQRHPRFLQRPPKEGLAVASIETNRQLPRGAPATFEAAAAYLLPPTAGPSVYLLDFHLKAMAGTFWGAGAASGRRNLLGKEF